jgi:hypothetical protein
MTEAEWLECSDPVPLLEFLRGKASDRKLRLFACACCQRPYFQVALKAYREAVEAAQREAPRGTPEVERLVDEDMATAAGWVILEDAWEAAYQVTAVRWDASWWPDEPGHQLALLHDILGNPFRPVPIDPACITPAVLQLAQALYHDRAFEQLPILADALEEAGCQDQSVLDHLRSPGPHVRGCWPLDLILGRA